MRCASPLSAHGGRTSSRHGTTQATRTTRACRRWVLRLRLKASFDVSGFPRQARIVLVALKRYGMLVADNGSSWYITGAPDSRWSNDQLHTLGRVKGSDFEVVGK